MSVQDLCFPAGPAQGKQQYSWKGGKEQQNYCVGPLIYAKMLKLK